MKNSAIPSADWRRSSPIIEPNKHHSHERPAANGQRPHYRLEPNEHITRVVKTHWTSMLPAIVFLGSLFVIPVTAALLSFWTIASISLITVAIINALALFLMKIRTNSNGVVVTNQRLICTHGLFETDMREIPIGHITNVASHHDFFQRLAGSGTVEVDVGGSLGPEIFPNVADPEGLAELLVHEVDRFESGMTGGALRANGTHDRPRRCPVDELSQLHRLLQEGALSNAEYEQLKAQLLNDSSNGFN